MYKYTVWLLCHISFLYCCYVVVKVSSIFLLQLKSRVSFHEHLLPVCLPPPNYELAPGTYCTVVGWGKREDRDGEYWQHRICCLVSAVHYLFCSICSTVSAVVSVVQYLQCSVFRIASAVYCLQCIICCTVSAVQYLLYCVCSAEHAV